MSGNKDQSIGVMGILIALLTLLSLAMAVVLGEMNAATKELRADLDKAEAKHTAYEVEISGLNEMLLDAELAFAEQHDFLLHGDVEFLESCEQELVMCEVTLGLVDSDLMGIFDGGYEEFEVEVVHVWVP